jgi:DNA invertase Pin-like site-specific DNA recombinase
MREAMAACRAGDVLVVNKLDRLARSLPDARDIVAELTAREVKLTLGGSVHDPTDPVGATAVLRRGHGRRVLCYLDTPGRLPP